jgi:hypothetical protein
MERVTNTETKQRNILDGFPESIVASEASGQQELVNSSQLPAFTCYSGDSKADLEAHGIKVIGRTPGDESFYDVELPKGWKVEATDHSMWSKLLDEDKKERASVFYKAAFYDRKCHITFNKE